MLVLQLCPVDQRLALATDVNEDGLGADLEDPPLDDLSHLEGLLRPFAPEQGREIVLLVFVLRVTHRLILSPRAIGSKGLDV